MGIAMIGLLVENLSSRMVTRRGNRKLGIAAD
jgi:hypothetical protein